MKLKLILLIAVLFSGIFIFNIADVSAQENTVCCEKTSAGAYCQNVPADECAPGYRQVPTSCEATSFCKPGTCYDSTEGICADNTPQLVCNQNGGIWSEEEPLQCELGCCTLGDQAAFVSLVRCKRLSAFLGLETNYNQNINSELECVASVQGQDKGACVFESDFEKDCDFTTKAECDAKPGEFFSGKLCSAEELGTICGPTQETTCVPGRDEVYFLDSCGNTANIYDSSKIEDQEYWTDIKRKDESCGFGSGNQDSRSCGNCDYLQGSFCRSEDFSNNNPSYGDYICADLNCQDSEGNERLHGESWCISDPKDGDGQDRVGSASYKYSCVNGEVISEPCADFRNEVCIEEVVDVGDGFSQAACVVNRWRDCQAQDDEDDCLNTDRRDCYWDTNNKIKGQNGVCLPRTSPGLKFWDSEETAVICEQANAKCVVEFEKGLFGGEECTSNCECLTDNWIRERGEYCSALGDCGPGVNWAGFEGYDSGYNYKVNGKIQKSR